jgi:hypothetical protein
MEHLSHTTRYLLPFVLLFLTMNASADVVALAVTPGQVLSQTESVVTVSLDNRLADKVNSFSIGGQITKQLSTQTESGRYIALLKAPSLMTGRVKVLALDSQNKTLAQGDLEYVSHQQSDYWDKLGFMSGFILVLGFIPFFITWYDIKRSYGERKIALEKLAKGTVGSEELKNFYRLLEQGPPGLTGLTRGLLSVSLILLVGMSVFYIIVYTPDVPELGERLLILIAGTLTSVIGFYFGSRANATPFAAKSLNEPGTLIHQTLPVIDSIKPDTLSAGAGVVVLDLVGRAFGDQKGLIEIKDRGNQTVLYAIESWREENIQIKIDVPKQKSELTIGITRHDGMQSKLFSITVS